MHFEHIVNKQSISVENNLVQAHNYVEYEKLAVDCSSFISSIYIIYIYIYI